MKLKRQVSRLTRVAINKIQYQYDFSQIMSTGAGLPGYLATPLFKFNSWTRIFGTDADDEANKQALIRSVTGRWQLATNEPDNRTYSLWIVSLKDNASDLLEVGTGNLLPLTAGTHYIGDSDRVLRIFLLLARTACSWVASASSAGRAVCVCCRHPPDSNSDTGCYLAQCRREARR